MILLRSTRSWTMITRLGRVGLIFLLASAARLVLGQQSATVAKLVPAPVPGQTLPAGSIPPPVPAPASDAVPDGKAVFLAHCAQCHGVMGQGQSGITSVAGPNLQAEHDYGHVLTAIETGPSHMPAFSYILPAQQIRSAADYVTQTLAIIPLTGGNLSEGGQLFRLYCAACHRTAVRGGALVDTGINAPSLVDKSPALIAGAIRWGPGPMPAFPQPVLTDQQLASIVDYVTVVQHPQHPGGTTLRWIGPVAEGFIGFIAVFGIIAFCIWIEQGGKG